MTAHEALKALVLALFEQVHAQQPEAVELYSVEVYDALAEQLGVKRQAMPRLQKALIALEREGKIVGRLETQADRESRGTSGMLRKYYRLAPSERVRALVLATFGPGTPFAQAYSEGVRELHRRCQHRWAVTHGIRACLDCGDAEEVDDVPALLPAEG